MNNTLAFIFPGQGSQAVGMLAPFADEPVVRQTLREASDALGYDMADLIQNNPDERLHQTEFTQPALLTTSTALLRLWRERGGTEAGHLAGHSLGEYSALVAAGSLNFADAVQLVAFRGRAMVAAVPEGTGLMAAILGLARSELEKLCAEVSTENDGAWAANDNCPGQVVVAGNKAAVERLIEVAMQAGAKRAMPLAVSAPSHTPLMQPAADALAEKLNSLTVNDADRPVWSNALAAPIQEADAIRAALVSQLVSPVRWNESVAALGNAGVTTMIEVGPGKVLSGLVRRISKGCALGQTETPELLAKALQLAASQAL